MSGHSKWATTKRQKFAADAKRASAFTKLAKAITLAAQELGGDPDTNFKLRLAIDKARAANMPKDNIDRAVKRGTGENSDGVQIEEIAYEGFGPAGSAFYVKTLTDNRNRTVASIKHIFTRHGGSLGGPNSVAWMFSQRGLIILAETTDTDKAELAAIEAGAQDVIVEDQTVIVMTAPSELNQVKDRLINAGYKIEQDNLEFIANETLDLDEPTTEIIKQIVEALSDDEDVTEVFCNVNY